MAEPTTPSVTVSTNTCITQTAYTTGQAAWSDAVNADGDVLRSAFVISNQRINCLTFPMTSVQEVLSAVGARYVRLDFLLIPTSTATTGGFTAVLYAVNDKGQPLTAYYGPATATVLPQLVGNGEVPASLVTLWKNNWTGATVKKDLFMTTSGTGTPTPLLGYRFDVDSIVSALFIAGESPTMNLLFALHNYFGPDSLTTQLNRFGVVLTPSNPGPGAAAALFHDMLMPCPPY